MNIGRPLYLALLFFSCGLSIHVRAEDAPAPTSLPEAPAHAPKPPFEDGTLRLIDAVDLALRHNLALQIQRTQVDDAYQNLLIAQSEFEPAATTSASSTFRQSPGAASSLDGSAQPENRSSSIDAGLDTKLASGATVGLSSNVLDRSKTNSSFRLLNPVFDSSLSLQVRQPVLKNAGFRYNLSNIRLAKLGIDQSNSELLSSLLELIGNTENAYWDVVASEAELDITRRSIELSELLVEEAEERKKAALATQADLLEAQSSLAERQELLLQAQANVEASRDNLFQILGLLEQVDPMMPDFENLPPRVYIDCNPQESFERAKQYAPAMQVALIQSQRQRMEVARQKNQLLPEVDLVATTGLLGQAGKFQAATRSVRDVDGHFWDAGVEIRIPLGNRLERARLAQARNELERAQLTEDNTRLDLYALVRAACRDIEVARKSFEASEVTVRFAELSLEQQRETYKQGQLTIRDVLESQNTLDSARFRQIQARIRELIAIVQLAEVEGTLPERYGLSFGQDDPES